MTLEPLHGYRATRETWQFVIKYMTEHGDEYHASGIRQHLVWLPDSENQMFVVADRSWSGGLAFALRACGVNDEPVPCATCPTCGGAGYRTVMQDSVAPDGRRSGSVIRETCIICAGHKFVALDLAEKVIKVEHEQEQARRQRYAARKALREAGIP